MKRFQKFLGVALFCPLIAWTQSQSSEGIPVQMVVSVGHFYSEQAPVPTRENLTVSEGLADAQVLEVTPVRSPLELFMLVDQCSSCEPGSKFEELQKFLLSQAPTTRIGVAYIKDGKLQIAVNPTTDRDRAIKGLSAPEGSKPSNPFVALADLIRQWAPDSARHVVLMISNGLDPAGSQGLRNAPAEAAIEQAERAGVMVFAMYHPSADYATADWSKLYDGQVQLAHVATETGGEAYFLGFGPMPSLAPFLADLGDHLANQYQVQFLARPGAAGNFAEITVKSTDSNVEIMAPSRVWVPAGK
ncbi:MAG TPA: hypothetical protein VMB85_03350 [Bryobacteraceae bacterium]|nr:hypothetical protein [Bryobacteraceae bacterium]